MGVREVVSLIRPFSLSIWWAVELSPFCSTSPGSITWEGTSSSFRRRPSNSRQFLNLRHYYCSEAALPSLRQNSDVDFPPKDSSVCGRICAEEHRLPFCVPPRIEILKLLGTIAPPVVAKVQ